MCGLQVASQSLDGFLLLFLVFGTERQLMLVVFQLLSLVIILDVI